MKKILKNKSKNSRNKVFESFIKQNQEQQGLILLNNIVKTKNKFNLGSMENKKQRQMAQNFGFESQALNTVAEKNMDSQFYRRIIKEKVNQENYSRHELMSKIFVDIYNLTSSFNEKKNKIKIDIINLQDSLDKMRRDSKISKEESMLIIRQKALERNQLEKNVKELYRNYQKDLKKLDDLKNKMKKEMYILKDEENYIKLVKLSLISSQKEYYIDILKKGYDVRNDGLVWCVKNLLELQTDLEYYHFPKFLDHQECDYLIEQAFRNDSIKNYC